jgi:hypothetical protein
VSPVDLETTVGKASYAHDLTLDAGLCPENMTAQSLEVVGDRSSLRYRHYLQVEAAGTLESVVRVARLVRVRINACDRGPRAAAVTAWPIG